MQAVLRSLGLDPRFASMLMALLVIWLGLQLMTHGLPLRDK